MKRALAATYRFEWKPQDCWIGFFWKKQEGAFANRLDVWVCILPMLPFHYTLLYV